MAFSHLPYLLGGALVTLHLTFFGFVIGLLIGLVASVLQAYGGSVLRSLASGYIVFFTNTPSLVTAFFLFFGLPEFGILLSPYECILINLALNAGALGGKINGSGGGGCMFAYSPESPEKVAEAIESVGGKAYIIQSDEGTKLN